MITIRDVFTSATGEYRAPITITLDKIRNPVSNKDLVPFELRTYDDPDKVYPIDMLDFIPNTPCEFPCLKCSSDRSYCYSCWQSDPMSFLMTTDTFSTCKEECDSGYTRNGNANNICRECDVSCSTCIDEGQDGDMMECITCAAGYNLRIGR